MKQNKIPRNEYIRKPVGKTNPYKHDVLYTNLGQWKYPGQVTRIPSNDITMQGVPYPVYGEDDLGYSQMMYPGMDYQFPGQYVTETPMAQEGIEINDPYFSKGYWKDPNTRSKNLVQTQVKKPENLIIQAPYVNEIPTHLKKNKQQFKEIPLSNNIEDRDSWLENIAEVFDPTGLSSWDDVYRAYKNTGLSGETALEAFGAIPLLGKIGKSGKIITGGFGLLQDAVKASKYLPASKQQKFIDQAFNMYQKYNKAGGKELDEALGSTTKVLRDKIPYINPNKWSSSDKAINIANKSFKAGRLSDAVQAALGAKDNSGFTWDMRHGEVPKYGGRNIFPQIELGEHGDFAYGGDPSLPNITGHYQKGGPSVPPEKASESSAMSEEDLFDNYYNLKQTAEAEKKRVEEVRKKAASIAASKAESKNPNTRTDLSYIKTGAFYCNIHTGECLQDAGATTPEGKPVPVIPGNLQWDSMAPGLGFEWVDEPQPGDVAREQIYRKSDYQGNPLSPGFYSSHSGVVTQVIDPNDPSKVFIGNAPGGVRNKYVNETISEMVHNRPSKDYRMKYQRYVGNIPKYEQELADLQNKISSLSTNSMPMKTYSELLSQQEPELQLKKTGGWLDELDEEYRRGGSVNPLMRSRSKRASTKKNIQSSINKIFLRNYDLFGPGGKNIYDPKAKYQQGGGWLDNLD